MSRAVDLLLACHPQPAAAVTVLGGVLAAASGRRRRDVVPVVLALGSGQLSVGWCNDWLDARRDAEVGRRDKPVAAGRVSVPTIRTAALTALGATGPLSLRLGRRAGALHLLAVGSAWSYDLGVKGTVASPVPYALSFGLLPTIAVGAPVRWWATAAGALLGTGAHFANALPDLDDDRRTGVASLPLRLGHRRSVATAATLLLAGTAVLAAAPAGRATGGASLALAAVVTAAGLAAGRREGSRAPFRAAMAVAGLDVALLVARGDQLRGAAVSSRRASSAGRRG